MAVDLAQNSVHDLFAGFLLEPGRRDLYSAISICVPATSHEAV